MCGCKDPRDGSGEGGRPLLSARRMLEGSAQGSPQGFILGMVTDTSHQLLNRARWSTAFNPREPWFTFLCGIQPLVFIFIGMDHSLQGEGYFSPARLEAVPEFNSSPCGLERSRQRLTPLPYCFSPGLY